MEKRNERGAVGDAPAAAQTDVQAIPYPQDHFRMTNLVPISAAGDNPKWLERLSGQEFLDGIESHADILSVCRTAAKCEAPMRLFLAIELPDAVRKALGDLSSRLKDDADLAGCSWVRAQNLHVTVKFLGEVPEATLPAICQSLNQVRLDEPIRLSASRMELLPPHGPVRVIAAGLEGDRVRLERLHGQIEKACAGVGFPPEARKFRPHVTLARARRPLPSRVRRQIEQCTAGLLPSQELIVSEFVLMESRLKPDAAQYIPLARFPIGSGSVR